MKIYLIQPVRRLTPDIKLDIENYIYTKEQEGCTVYAPHRDTNEDGSELDICNANCKAIEEADEVHIFWDNGSLGCHFDLGIAFVLRKKLVLVKSFYEADEYTKGFEELIKQVLVCRTCGGAGRILFPQHTREEFTAYAVCPDCRTKSQ